VAATPGAVHLADPELVHRLAVHDLAVLAVHHDPVPALHEAAVTTAAAVLHATMTVPVHHRAVEVQPVHVRHN